VTSLRALVVEGKAGRTDVIRALEADRDIDAGDSCAFARVLDQVRLKRPDVVVMVPETEPEALAAIEHLMAHEPVPILVIGDQSFSRRMVLKAGAVEVIPRWSGGAIGESEFRLEVRRVSRVNVIRHIRGRSRPRPSRAPLPIVGIAASTGGPQAVVAVLRSLAGLEAAVLVVQHLHPRFTGNFKDWIEREAPMPVEVAVAGTRLRAGHVYLAPPDLHLKLGPERTVLLERDPPTLHRPSADILFRSIAEHAGADGVGVLLTGMGDDGAAGLLEMRSAGARTIAQDETSSAVYGMPRAADRLGAAEQVLPLEQIAAAILRVVKAMI
jgi:two-component system, chemotaxis family, protein-glutamate methylesterase/glutaminase